VSRNPESPWRRKPMNEREKLIDDAIKKREMRKRESAEMNKTIVELEKRKREMGLPRERRR